MCTFEIFSHPRRVLSCHGKGDGHYYGSLNGRPFTPRSVAFSGIPFFDVLDDWRRAGYHSVVAKKVPHCGDNWDGCSCAGIGLLRGRKFWWRRNGREFRYSILIVITAGASRVTPDPL